MNIIYMHSHDTGRYIQPYGYNIPTPNLQIFAEKGALFRNAHCTAPTCSPSRAGMLLGQMPHCTGMWGLAHRGFSLSRPNDHIAAFLRQHGFETVLCGIQHEAENAGELGYTRILDTQDYAMSSCNRDWRGFDIGNAGLAANYLKQPHSTPFFLSYGIFNTHRKFPELLPDDTRADYVMPPAPIADTPANRRDMAAYIESAKILDECVGIVLAALKESKYEDDTIVFYTTDHGISFPEMKCTLYDTGIGVSLIFAFKNNALEGFVCDALVSHLDIFPTLCDMVNVPKPAGLQGVSLMPLLKGECNSVRDEIFAENSFHVSYEPKRCIRTERYKYIRNYSAYGKPIPANTDDCPDKTVRIESGYYNRSVESEQLFDLLCDPFERVNLVQDRSVAEIKFDLARRLFSWMKKTDDPLLCGVMQPPAGAKVNYPGSLSPSEKVFINDWDELM
jgi:arylsulfatase A-like enzyme